MGSGAGGALTSSFLAEKGRDVLIVEEGPDIKSTLEDSNITNAFPDVWRNGGVIPISGNANMAFAEGRCLGGSTMINSGLIHRLPVEIIEEWGREFKIRELNHDLMQGFHNSIERELSVAAITNSKNIANALFKKGAGICGFKGVDVPVAAEFKDGLLKKRNMRVTYLQRAEKSGARIVTDCRVDKITVNNGKATEVMASYKDIKGSRFRLSIQFDKLFLCAGAIQTPLLLRRSGIKNNVGDNIHFHPTFRTVAEFDMPLNAYAVEMPSFQIKEFAPEISMGASVVTPAYIAVGLAGNWAVNRHHMKDFNSMATFYVMTRSSSRGKVRNIPLFKGSYNVRYMINNTELRNLSFGFAKLAEVLFAAGAKRLYPSIEGGLPITDKKESAHYLENNLPVDRISLMSIHSFSSCPMGEDRDRCAVDSFGRLHGFENIYVNDASILPSSPGVNPQGPLMAVALRNLERNFGK